MIDRMSGQADEDPAIRRDGDAGGTRLGKFRDDVEGSFRRSVRRDGLRQFRLRGSGQEGRAGQRRQSLSSVH
jgi:hypothetical protein